MTVKKIIDCNSSLNIEFCRTVYSPYSSPFDLDEFKIWWHTLAYQIGYVGDKKGVKGS